MPRRRNACETWCVVGRAPEGVRGAVMTVERPGPVGPNGFPIPSTFSRQRRVTDNAVAPFAAAVHHIVVLECALVLAPLYTQHPSHKRGSAKRWGWAERCLCAGSWGCDSRNPGWASCATSPR